jgi:ribosome assembly protein 1
VGLLQEVEGALASGFQVAMGGGPLCEEPLQGVAVVLDGVDFTPGLSPRSPQWNEGGPLKGQILTAVKEGVRMALGRHQQRLVEPLYLCVLQVSPAEYGNACAVLARRRAKVIGEDMQEGTGLFVLRAYLPVVESFGLSLEIRTKTSGAGQVQLSFSHWALLDQNPNFVPTTEEELEEFGTNTGGMAPNLARQLINDVRKRKGLHVEEQLVEHADKQRTLSKKK